MYLQECHSRDVRGVPHQRLELGVGVDGGIPVEEDLPVVVGHGQDVVGGVDGVHVGPVRVPDRPDPDRLEGHRAPYSVISLTSWRALVACSSN